MRGFKKSVAKLRTTADKREIKDSPKLPSATSFIRKPLGETAVTIQIVIVMQVMGLLKTMMVVMMIVTGKVVIMVVVMATAVVMIPIHIKIRKRLGE